MRRANVGQPPSGWEGNPLLTWLVNALMEVQTASHEETTDQAADENAATYLPIGDATVAAAWGRVTQAAGTYTLRESSNITSIAKTGTGVVEITIASDMSSANYCVVVSANELGNFIVLASGIVAGGFTVTIRTSTAGGATESGFSFAVFDV